MLIMKAPASRGPARRTVRCNEAQADILRKIGWTESNEVASEADPVEPLTMILPEGEPPPGLTIKEPPEDPDEERGAEGEEKPKRRYSRRTVTVETDGSVNYKVKPKRQYRRRDMKAEE